MSRTPPDLVGLEALFQTLQDKYGRGGFELLAIGLAPAGEANDARGGEGSPDHAPAFTLLLQKTGNAATPGACLRVYLQRCVGSYTGDKFTDPRDAAAFETFFMTEPEPEPAPAPAPASVSASASALDAHQRLQPPKPVQPLPSEPLQQQQQRRERRCPRVFNLAPDPLPPRTEEEQAIADGRGDGVRRILSTYFGEAIS